VAANPLQLFQRLGRRATGRWLFSRAVCLKAPYFASIAPLIEVLEPGRCVASIAHRRKVQNHIGTVHAIALCNLAELTAGLGTDVSIPASMRWIPKGMTVRYLKKASGRMRATATIPAVADGAPAQDLVVHVDVRDPADAIVFDADITMYVSPRKAA
jgi:acyl-coenzyme A thioesterase PaaI-like protein